MKYEKLIPQELVDAIKADKYYADVALPKDIVLKLAELEEALATGTIKTAPCKKGDVLYSVPFNCSEIFEHRVKGFRLIVDSESSDNPYVHTDADWFGEYVFTDKVEAEKRRQQLLSKESK